jgi:hypothetical protein
LKQELEYEKIISVRVKGDKSVLQQSVIFMLTVPVPCGDWKEQYCFSDGVLAINRFMRSFRAAQAVILATYFTEQWLIALSVQG